MMKNLRELSKTIKRYDTNQNRIVLDWSVTGILAIITIVALILAC